LQFWPWILISLLEDCLCSHAKINSRGFNVAASFSLQDPSSKAALWSVAILEGIGLDPRRRAKKAKEQLLASSSLHQHRKPRNHCMLGQIHAPKLLHQVPKSKQTDCIAPGTVLLLGPILN
jgi:hypothetical protein